MSSNIFLYCHRPHSHRHDGYMPYWIQRAYYRNKYRPMP